MMIPTPMTDQKPIAPGIPIRMRTYSTPLCGTYSMKGFVSLMSTIGRA